jgi:hypothetical protein
MASLMVELLLLLLLLLLGCQQVGVLAMRQMMALACWSSLGKQPALAMLAEVGRHGLSCSRLQSGSCPSHRRQRRTA